MICLQSHCLLSKQLHKLYGVELVSLGCLHPKNRLLLKMFMSLLVQTSEWSLEEQEDLGLISAHPNSFSLLK